jgi:hypothetical protein
MDVRTEPLQLVRKLRVVDPYKWKPYREVRCAPPGTVRIVGGEAPVATCASHPIVKKYRVLFALDRFDDAANACCAIHAKCYTNATFKTKPVLTSKGCDDVLFQCMGLVYNARPFGLQKLRFFGTMKKLKNLVAVKSSAGFSPAGHCEVPYNSGFAV